MSKKNKNKKSFKEFKKEMIASVPDEIKVIYGKFIVFSIIYLIFFFIIYPLLLVDMISKLSSIIIFVVLITFYVYMIIDVWKKKKTYISDGYVIIIPLVFVAISFSLVKFLF